MGITCRPTSNTDNRCRCAGAARYRRIGAVAPVLLELDHFGLVLHRSSREALDDRAAARTFPQRPRGDERLLDSVRRPDRYVPDVAQDGEHVLHGAGDDDGHRRGCGHALPASSTWGARVSAESAYDECDQSMLRRAPGSALLPWTAASDRCAGDAASQGLPSRRVYTLRRQSRLGRHELAHRVIRWLHRPLSN
jgi:hypothetical protein